MFCKAVKLIFLCPFILPVLISFDRMKLVQLSLKLVSTFCKCSPCIYKIWPSCHKELKNI